MDPAAGHRFNPAKLLIDPYAKAIEGPIGYDRARVLAYTATDEDAADGEDSAAATRARSSSTGRSTGRGTSGSTGRGPRR